MLALDVERVMRLAPPTAAEAHVGALTTSVGRAYLNACRSGTALMDGSLRQAVVALVAHLRENGLPPERVVVLLKQALIDGDNGHALPSLGRELSIDEDRHQQHVYQSALRWCLDAYYA